ncbi:MAG: hypothetical protein Q9159_004258 [Coniocarpon cinnabarinum]
MHLNVPEKNMSRSSYVKKYCTWGLIGIFGPELAIWAAWRQFLSAKALRDEVRQMQAEEKYPKVVAGKPWTLTHGYYAAMGGFVIDLDNKGMRDDSKFTEHFSRLTLTPKGVRLLAECEYLPDISVEEIDDKSKTDELGKALACLQAVWMVIQVCDRLALKLPVTLLEVTTMGHVLCALVLYSLWWCKPRWIQEPTKIEGVGLQPIFAFMFMASQMSETSPDRYWLRAKFDARGSEISKLLFRNREGTAVAQVDDVPHGHARMSAGSSSEDASSTGEKGSPTTQHGHFIVRANTTRPPSTSMNEDEESMAEWLQGSDEISSRRHTLAAQAIAAHAAIRHLLHPKRSHKERRYYEAIKMYPEMPQAFRMHRQQPATPKIADGMLLECDTEHFVTFEASDWPTDGLLRSMDRSVDRVASTSSSGLVISAFLWLASIAFAGVHVAAWDAAFPTPIEAWIWRISSAFIGASGLIWLAITMVAQFSKHVWWLWYDLLSDDAPKWCKVVLICLCVLCGCGYVFSRIFLIVEAFVTLRNSPVASFVVPQWTLSVPHL